MEKPILAAMLSISETKLSDDEKRLFEQFNPLGITLFAKNIENKSQLKSLTKEINEVIGRENVLIAIDQEGGRVRRLKEPEFRSYAAQIELGRLDEKYDHETVLRTVRNHALLISQDLLECGINWNYAPCLDICYPQTSEVLKSRCLGNDEKKVAQLGHEMIEAYIQSGICPCIKHIPGHFSTLNDPHLSVPETELSRWEIEKKTAYLHSFSKFPLAMTSHILLKSFDAEYPATQSPKVISELIRGYLEFDGFLLSDAIDMHALKGTIAERASLSIRAGVDAVCCCSGRIKDLTAVCGERCFMTEKSLQRYANIKKVIHNKPKCVDVKNIELQYKEKIGSILNVKCSYDATEVLHQMLKKGES